MGINHEWIEAKGSMAKYNGFYLQTSRAESDTSMLDGTYGKFLQSREERWKGTLLFLDNKGVSIIWPVSPEWTGILKTGQANQISEDTYEINNYIPSILTTGYTWESMSLLDRKTGKILHKAIYNLFKTKSSAERKERDFFSHRKIIGYEDVKVPAGVFKNCLKIIEVLAIPHSSNSKIWNGSLLISYYAPDVGLVKSDGWSQIKIEIDKGYFSYSVVPVRPKDSIRVVSELKFYDVKTGNGPNWSWLPWNRGRFKRLEKIKKVQDAIRVNAIELSELKEPLEQETKQLFEYVEVNVNYYADYGQPPPDAVMKEISAAKDRLNKKTDHFNDVFKNLRMLFAIRDECFKK